MTKIDIFSGFLGAGKTTLIKKLIKEAYNGEKVVLIENALDDKQTIDLDLAKTIYDRIHTLTDTNQLLAASTVGFNGILKELIEMSYGNNIGVDVADDRQSILGQAMMGSFILELAADTDCESLLDGLDYQVLGQTQELAQLQAIGGAHAGGHMPLEGVQAGAEQILGGDVEHVAQSHQRLQAGNAGAAFQMSHEGCRDAHLFGQIFLGHFGGFAQGADACAHILIINNHQ